jgi:hypothetical protein
VKQRIAIMPGCVQGALSPQIDGAVGRVLARRGIELVALEGAAVAARCRIIWAAKRIPGLGEKGDRGLTSRASMTAC